MWMPLILTRHSVRRMRSLLLTMTVILTGFQLLLAALADLLGNSSAFSKLAGMAPPAVRQLMGPSLVTMLSVSGVMALGYFHTAIEAALVALVIMIGSEPVGELEAGFTDLALSRPMGRSAVMMRTLILMLVCPTVVVGAMGLGTAAGEHWVLREGLPGPEPRLVWSIALNLWALLIAWGGIMMAVASVSRRRGGAIAVVATAALVATLADYLARAWAPLQKFAWLSPFHYYSPLDLVTGAALSWTHVLTLLGIAATGVAAAFVLFARRDL